jgi:hypothetical protein
MMLLLIIGGWSIASLLVAMIVARLSRKQYKPDKPNKPVDEILCLTDSEGRVVAALYDPEVAKVVVAALYQVGFLTDVAQEPYSDAIDKSIHTDGLDVYRPRFFREQIN